MQTITLTAGQISQIVEVGPGTRITSSGNGNIEWVAGALADAKNGSGTWANWPKGSSAGNVDTVRRMCIRATATGAMTVTLDESKQDDMPDGAYWDSQVVTTQTNATTGLPELLGPDGVIDDLNLKPSALLDGRFVAGQPLGITRPVTKGGKMVCRFVASECTAVGTPTLADHSGYDSNGVVTGVVSRTGLPSMLKVTPADDTTEGFQLTSPSTSLLTKTVNGKIGVWVYVETQPGYQPGGTPGGTLEMALTRNTGNSFAQGVLVYFNNNQLKEGWNFLVFVMRNPAAYVTSGGVTEYHPFGILPTSNGTGADSDIVNNNLGSIRFLYSGTGITATNIYFDSVWTDFDVTPQAFIGHDTADSSIADISLPKFEQYGWKGYFTANANYWDGVESRIWTDYSTGLNSYSDTLYGAGWEAINHTLQHLPGSAASPTMATLTSAGEIAYEIMAMHALLRSAGFSRGAEFYAAPISAQSRLSEAVIKGCGYKVQRIARGQNIQVTPWGVPNPSHVGSIGMGSPVASAYTSITNGVSTASTGLNNITKMRNLIDAMIAYGATFTPFTHTLETAGDDGSGNGTPAVNTNCMASLFNLSMDYIAEKEAAGLIRVRDGFTGFYYGVGR